MAIETSSASLAARMTAPAQQATDVQNVLAQIRKLRGERLPELTQAMNTPDIADPNRLQAQTSEPTSFRSMVVSALDRVNELQQASGAASKAFVTGQSDDLIGTMLASQKSSIAFQATVQVRNRVVSAYQDIMNMPI